MSQAKPKPKPSKPVHVPTRHVVRSPGVVIAPVSTPTTTTTTTTTTTPITTINSTVLPSDSKHHDHSNIDPHSPHPHPHPIHPISPISPTSTTAVVTPNPSHPSHTTTPPTKIESKLGRQYNLVLFNPATKRHKLHHHQLLAERKLTAAASLPSSYFIPVNFPPYDQGDIGSCTANALCAAFKIQQQNSSTSYDPSRLFLYYEERAIENSLSQEGAVLDDGMNVLKNIGVCTESTWPYNTSQEDVKPPAFSFLQAKGNNITEWGVVNPVPDTVTGIKQVLNENLTVAIGIMVYESFESDSVANSGMVPVPNTKTESLLGGHAILIVGYDDSKNAFLVQNSWGPNWGTNQPGNTNFRGFCYIPYLYIGNANLCDECLFMTGININPVQITPPAPTPPIHGPLPTPSPPHPTPPPPHPHPTPHVPTPPHMPTPPHVPTPPHRPHVPPHIPSHVPSSHRPTPHPNLHLSSLANKLKNIKKHR